MMDRAVLTGTPSAPGSTLEHHSQVIEEATVQDSIMRDYSVVQDRAWRRSHAQRSSIILGCRTN